MKYQPPMAITGEMLLAVEIPKSAYCPHYAKGQFSEGHQAVSYQAKMRGRTEHQFWRCSVCRSILSWDKEHSVYVSKFVIEEEPW